MNSETGLAKSNTTSVVAVPTRSTLHASAHIAAPATPNLVRIVHRALRGRYIVVGLIAALIGAASAVIGYRLMHPTYRSEGLVQIAYTLPEVAQETDQNGPLVMFDTFMQSQRMLMSSRRVIDMAVQDPIWKTMGCQVPPKPDQYFAAYLKVDVSHQSEYMAVSVSDPDPATAAAAVTSVINAYIELYKSRQEGLDSRRLGVLEDKENGMQSRIDELDVLLRDGEKDWGTNDLSPFFDAAAARVTKLQTALGDVRAAMATAPATTTPQAALAPALAHTSGDTLSGSDGSAGNTGRNELSIPQIAAADPVMGGYVRDLEQLEEGLDQIKARGYGEAHRLVIDARRSIAAARHRVDNYAEMYRQFHAATAQSLGDPRNTAVATTGKTVEELRSNEKSIAELLDKTKAEMIAIGVKQGNFRRAAQELRELRDQQDQLKKRLSVLKTEGQLGGRVSIASMPEIALSPERDLRVRAAAAAGAGGACLPVGIAVLLSFVRRRYHYSDDTEADVSLQRIPMLGIVPEIDGLACDPEEMAAAAHSVHQLRVTLRSLDASAAPRVYVITSASPGEGKTSLAMSLGLAFATARLKTLIIDGDLVGRKLTGLFGARAMEGLHEALGSKTLRGRVRRTSEGLYVLPAGNVKAAHACSLSPTTVNTLLTEAKRHFDVVLVDTGPILGSIEASVLACEADGVIFTITRGQDRNLVEKGLNRIRNLGASVLGCVFNRAQGRDFSSSPYGSSARSLSDEVGASAEIEIGRRYERFGALVKAVATSLPFHSISDACEFSA